MTGAFIWGRIRGEVLDAKTGAVVRTQGWNSNLAFDTMLNAMAGGTQGFSSVFSAVKIGSGNSPNTIGGAVTFTQVGNQVTASSVGWFTANLPAGMSWTNSLLRYNNASAGAGLAQYISSIDGTGTIATVIGSATVAASAALIYFVNQTTLQNYLYGSSTYQTTTGSNKTAYSANQLTLQRTIYFPVQSTSYNVNEIGYNNTTGGGGAVSGRIVLSSADPVAPTQFYVVTIQMTYLESPATITAVANFGTAFDTSGTAAWQNWSCQIVNTDGSVGTINGGAGRLMDAGGGMTVVFNRDNTLIQSSIPLTTAAVDPVDVTYRFDTPGPTNSGQLVGVGVITAAPYAMTTAGEIVYSLCFGGNLFTTGGFVFSINLTNPQTLPSGIFQGNISFQWTFSRTLVN